MKEVAITHSVDKHEQLITKLQRKIKIDERRNLLKNHILKSRGSKHLLKIRKTHDLFLSSKRSSSNEKEGEEERKKYRRIELK